MPGFLVIVGLILLLLTFWKAAYLAFCTVCLPNNHPRNIALKQRLNPHVKYRKN